MNIRFQNLPKLLNSMKEKEYVIDSFPFLYKGERYIVILKLFGSNERKPNKHAQVKLEFILSNDTTRSIHAFADFYEVRFNSVSEFIDFFNIQNTGLSRDLFLDFSEIFAKYIPFEKIVKKDDPQLSLLIGRRAEGCNPNAIYCFDVRRNGRTNGHPNKRSVENSNKAEALRPNLYNRYKDDKNFSFFFSDNPADEKSDDEIINQVANR